MKRVTSRVTKSSVREMAELPKFSEEEIARMRRVKEPITIRLDSDIVAWLKSQSGPYQTRVNNILRHYMEHSHQSQSSANG